MVKRVLFIAVLLALVLSAFLPQVAMAQTTVVSGYVAGSSMATISFATESRQWVFYGGIYYKVSTDLTGSSWGSQQTIPHDAYSGNNGFDVAYDGTRVHYVAGHASGAYYIWYVGGVPDDETGTITWDTIYTLYGSGVVNVSSPTIAVDTSGYKHVIYQNYTGSQLIHCKSTTANDTAFTASFSNNIQSGRYSAELHALTSNKLVVVYSNAGVANHGVYVKRYNGSVWDPPVETTSDIVDYSLQFSSVAHDDDIDITFTEDVSFDILYTKYSYSTNSFNPSPETVLHAGCISTTAPAITRSTTQNNLVVFYEVNPPTDDKVYAAIYYAGNDEWVVDYEWVTDSVGLEAAQADNLSAPEAQTDDQIGLFWTASTNTLRFHQFAAPWRVETLDPSGVTSTEATLRGNIISTGSGTIAFRSFHFGTDPTLAIYTEYGEPPGTFGVGVYSYTVEDLESDSIYYYKAVIEDSYANTAEGNITVFLTQQPGYESEDEMGDSTLTPPLPGEPGGWIRPPKDWGDFVPGIPWTAVMWLVLTALVIMIGFALTKWAKSLALLFMVLGFIIGIFCFFPKGGYLDWWVMLPYILVGWALISRQKESPVGE